MAIEKRVKTTKSRARRKEYSYRVKWRLNGTGPQQSKTVDNLGDAEQLEEALSKSGWKYAGTDPEVKYLTLIRGEVAPVVEDVTKGLTFGDALRRWATREGLSEGSIRIYNQTVRRMGDIGSRPLREVTDTEVEDWLKAQSRQLSSNTMSIMRIAVRGATTMYGRPDLTANLAKVAPRRKVTPVYLDPEQLDVLVASADKSHGHNFAMLVRLTGTMGPRWGEGVGLQPIHFHVADLSQAYFWVRQAVKNGHRLPDGFRPEPVKTEASERMVPLKDKLALEMADLIEGLPPDAPIFKPVGAPFWNARTFGYQWRLLKHATPEVPNSMRWHDLRHTAAQNMLEKGIPIDYVSRILGHSKIDVTRNEYGSFDQRSHDLVRSLL